MNRPKTTWLQKFLSDSGDFDSDQFASFLEDARYNVPLTPPKDGIKGIKSLGGVAMTEERFAALKKAWENR